MLDKLRCALCGDEFEGLEDDGLAICPTHMNLLGTGYIAFIAETGSVALVKRDLLPRLGFEFEDEVNAVDCSADVVAQLQSIAFALASEKPKHKVH